MPKAQLQCAFWAGLDAVAAADALGAVGLFAGIHAHPAFFGAFAAVDTRIFVKLHTVQGEFIEQTVDGTQGAQVFAEGTPDGKTGGGNEDQQKKLPQENATKLRPDHMIPDGEENTRNGSGGAEVLAEEGGQRHEGGQTDDQDEQYGVLETAKRLVDLKMIPFGNAGNEIQQLLEKSEGTQQAAHRPTQNRAEKQQQSYNIVWKAEFEPGEKALQRANGTGAHRTGAGIAV